MPKLTNAELVEHYARLEAQVIELAAKVERLRLDVQILSARVTLRPPPVKTKG